MKKFWLFAMVTALVLVMAACGSNNKAASTTNAGGTAEDSGTAAATEIVIKATNWKFDQPEYKIKKGEATKISFETEGVHGLEIPDLKVKLTNGKSQVVTINDAGEYELNCDVMCGTGHSQMTAKIVVE